MLAGVRPGRGDHGFVVGGQAVVNGAVEQHATEPDEVRIYFGFERKCYLGWFVVRALAQAYTDSVGQQFFNVRLGAVEVSLDDDSNSSAQVWACIEPPHDLQRNLGKRRVLHIDADKVVRHMGMLSEAFGDRLGQTG